MTILCCKLFCFQFPAKSEEELRRTRKEFEDMKRDKDQTIAELKFKIEHMESVYESILHVSRESKVKREGGHRSV